MKYTSLRDFSSYLQKISATDLPRSVLLQGSDFFDVQEAYRFFQECCLRLFGEKKVTFARVQDADLMESFFSPSLFARSRTVVVVEDFERLKAREQECMKRYLMRPGDTTLLLKTTSSATSEIVKLASSQGVVLSLPEDKPWDKEAKVANWVAAFCQSRQVAISSQLAVFIARECGGQEMHGSSRFFLQSELEKLLLYIGERKSIQEQDIEAVLTIEPKSTLWQFSDAFMQKNSRQALQILKALEEQEVHYFVIIRHLRHVAHQALQMRSLADEKEAVADIAARFPQLKGKMFEKTFQRAKELCPTFLARALVGIDKAESLLKDSPFDEQTVLINLLMQAMKPT